MTSNRFGARETQESLGSLADETEGGEDRRPETYDFRRTDRIAKDQLRAIHLIHENFSRSLASNLSAYLRAYVMVSLVRVEQLSFREFTQGIASPTCLVTMGLKPFENSAVLELTPNLVFPVLETLLGGNAKTQSRISREITLIEQTVLDGFLRLILQNLHSAWLHVNDIAFSADGYETEPALLQILAPNEALVAIGTEVRIGENAGMMNLGIPSIVIKMLRQKFDQQWSVRRAEMKHDEHARMLRLIRPAKVMADVRLQGPKLTVSELLDLRTGDVLRFDHNTEKPVDLLLNGRLKYRGSLVSTGRKKAFAIEEMVRPSE